MSEENQGTRPTPEQTAQQFELAKLDYARMATQEQALMDKRQEVWTKFFALLLIPSGYAGIVGLKGAIFLLPLVPFFLVCLALEVRHDEEVLRHDVRKGMKNLAARWGFANFDSLYSNQNGARWWHGYYKMSKAAAFLLAEGIVTGIIGWYFCAVPLLGVPLTILNALFIVFTAWCMLIGRK